MFSSSNEDTVKLLSDMNNKGYFRTLAKAKVTHSTLDYRLKKYRGNK